MKTIHKLRGQRGFTVFELTIVLTLAGGLLLMLTEFVRVNMQAGQYEETVDNLALIQDGLWEFSVREGRYPCPADPSLPPTDVNYGVEQCRNAADMTSNPDDCTGAPAGLACTTVSARDGDGNGQPDVVMIGAVPVRTIANVVLDVPFVENVRTDGWDWLFTYAVSEPMTNDALYSITNPVNPNIGAITIEDENKIDVLDPPGSAHYVVFSHGANGRGAFTDFGIQASDCEIPSVIDPDDDSYIPIKTKHGGGLLHLGGFGGRLVSFKAPATTGRGGEALTFHIPPPGPNPANISPEFENCDNNDAIFAHAILSQGLNSKYTDDLTRFNQALFSPLWQVLYGSPAGETYIHNTNMGNIGIGTQDPQYDLHVNADFMAERETLAEEFCDGTDINTCVKPTKIAGTVGSKCGDNKSAAYAITDSEIKCRTVNWTMPATACPAGTFLVGFSNAGNIHCEPLP